MDINLPKITKAGILGKTTEKRLESVLNQVANVTAVPRESDLGIDFHCEVIDQKGHPTGQTFSVQCKGSEIPHSPDNTEISVQIKVSTINYWLQQKSPVFLIYGDSNSKVFYWTATHHQILNNLDKIRNNKSVVIKIDKQNQISEDLKSLPPSFLKEIHNFDYAETQFEFNNSLSKTATKIDFSELQLEKNREKSLLIATDNFNYYYNYVSNIRNLFERHYMVSSIENWQGFGNQFQFCLYKRINSDSFYYVASVVISFRIDSNVIDYAVALTDEDEKWVASGENDLEYRIDDIHAEIIKHHKQFRS